MNYSIQVVLDHPSPLFSGDRTFKITEHIDGYSASCAGFGASRTYSTAIEAVKALFLENGCTERLTR